MKSRSKFWWILAAMSALLPAWGQVAKKDLGAMSIEELMQLQVTSVSKRNESIAHSAAAIFVITPEDIRRSGATSIPDLLRMVPGLEVAQINAHTWSITARGFSGRFANKLLVLVDGRTVYSPVFSGVFWDIQDTLLEDIERIEVIRGPGAALWGANAVNGVINIMTKKAEDTKGSLVTMRGGNKELASGDVRYGGALGQHGSYRIFGKYFDRNHFDLPTGGNGMDQWQMGHAGFRVDWDASARDSLTLEAEMEGGGESQRLVKLVSFSAPFTQLITDQVRFSQGDILARWKHTLSGGSGLSLQFYFDRNSRNEGTFGANRNTFDLDLQHTIQIGERHQIVWGLGYRQTSDEIGLRFGEQFKPPKRVDQLFSAFVQDEVSLVHNKLFLTLGSRFEHNSYTGFEIQPTVRILWSPNARHALWASVSRAVRTPNRADSNVEFIRQAVPLGGGATGFATIFGNPALQSETMIAYEAGYRLQPAKRVSFDIAGFYNRYDRLETAEPGAPFFQAAPPPPHIVIPLTFANQMHGNTHGIEIAAKWEVAAKWRLSAGYTWLVESLTLNPGSQAFTAPKNAQDVPRNQVYVRSLIDLPKHFEFDASLAHASKLGATVAPSHTRFDARLGWRPSGPIELSLVLQNGFHSGHAEFLKTELGEQATLVPRSVYVQLTWRFQPGK